MSRPFLTLFRPITWPGQTKLDASIPLVVIFLFAAASVFPMFQLYGWLISIAACPIAFLSICFVRAIFTGAWGLKRDSMNMVDWRDAWEGDMLSAFMCPVSVAVWWGFSTLVLHWHYLKH